MTVPVTICLVTYNRADTLPRTLDSLLGQTFRDFELIVSDDASSDQTEQVCRTYARQDSRIRYHRNPSNLGMPGNLNASIQMAQGEYIANLHDGDTYHPDLIARWKESLDTHPSAGFVFNAYRVRQGGTTRIFREEYPPLIPGAQLGARLLSRWDSCVFGTVMARHTVYQSVGQFDPCFGNFSDIDMWLRMAREYDVAYVDEPLMDLMPRDPTRFYAFVHWRVVFWILGIHVTNLHRYASSQPELVAHLSRVYRHRRALYIRRHMVACIRKGRWDRVKEALAIWRDADDWGLRALGQLLGDERNLPVWYTSRYWQMVGLSAVPHMKAGPQGPPV